jgi:hypothetical protein
MGQAAVQQQVNFCYQFQKLLGVRLNEPSPPTEERKDPVVGDLAVEVIPRVCDSRLWQEQLLAGR